jgi:hypothetical protein
VSPTPPRPNGRYHRAGCNLTQSREHKEALALQNQSQESRPYEKAGGMQQACRTKKCSSYMQSASRIYLPPQSKPSDYAREGAMARRPEHLNTPPIMHQAADGRQVKASHKEDECYITKCNHDKNPL